MKIDKRIAGVLVAGAACWALAAPLTAATVQNAGGISYVNGGIGKEEADEMREHARHFPVQMTFVRRGEGNREEFVTDVRVRISQPDGKVMLELPSQGPIFLVQLPDGQYVVDAEYGKQVQRRQLQIAGAQPQKLAFMWQ